MSTLFPKLREAPTDPYYDDPKNRTVPADARFHNANATEWCFTSFVDHTKCLRLLGEKCECCRQFEKIFKAICPNAWVERWKEQIEEGIFPVDLPEPKQK
ncbi:cytochrome c oxidase subunit 6b-2 [Dendroctonus ponderosae]